MLVLILDGFILTFEQPDIGKAKAFWDASARIVTVDHHDEWLSGWKTAFMPLGRTGTRR